MGAVLSIVSQIDAQLPVIVATLWVGELFVLCSVWLAERNSRRLARKVDALLKNVELLKRSEEMRLLREIAASTRGTREEIGYGQVQGEEEQGPLVQE
jgi:hypothetical protein